MDERRGSAHLRSSIRRRIRSIKHVPIVSIHLIAVQDQITGICLLYLPPRSLEFKAARQQKSLHNTFGTKRGAKLGHTHYWFVERTKPLWFDNIGIDPA